MGEPLLASSAALLDPGLKDPETSPGEALHDHLALPLLDADPVVAPVVFLAILQHVALVLQELLVDTRSHQGLYRTSSSLAASSLRSSQTSSSSPSKILLSLVSSASSAHVSSVSSWTEGGSISLRGSPAGVTMGAGSSCSASTAPLPIFSLWVALVSTQ
jgi:hypothetical protein